MFRCSISILFIGETSQPSPNPEMSRIYGFLGGTFRPLRPLTLR